MISSAAFLIRSGSSLLVAPKSSMILASFRRAVPDRQRVASKIPRNILPCFIESLAENLQCLGAVGSIADTLAGFHLRVLISTEIAEPKLTFHPVNSRQREQKALRSDWLQPGEGILRNKIWLTRVIMCPRRSLTAGALLACLRSRAHAHCDSGASSCAPVWMMRRPFARRRRQWQEPLQVPLTAHSQAGQLQRMSEVQIAAACSGTCQALFTSSFSS
jgi:hypothetical protein